MKLPNLLASKRGRLTAFFFLYMAEGLPLGFSATAIVDQMRRQGLEPGETAPFVAMLYLPWSFKWIMGPVVDVVYSNRLGRRRGWIAVMQSLLIICLMIGMGIDFTAELQMFSILMLIANVFSATQDVAIDALACGSLQSDERGFANGLMFAGAVLGNMIGGSGSLFLSHRLDFDAAFIFIIGCMLAILLFVAFPLKEAKTVRAEGEGLGQIKKELGQYVKDVFHAFFRTRGGFLAAVFAILPCGSYALNMNLGTNLGVELNMSKDELATMGIATGLSMAFGCVLGGKLSDLFGRRRMIALYVCLTSIPTLLFGWWLWRHGWIMPVDTKDPSRPIPPEALVIGFWVAGICFNLVHGLMYGTRTALFMDVCNPAIAAVQFTAYMSLLNLVISYTAYWQGKMASAWGYPMVLLIDGLVGLVCLLVLPWIKPRDDQNEPHETLFPDGPGPGAAIEATLPRGQ